MERERDSLSLFTDLYPLGQFRFTVKLRRVDFSCTFCSPHTQPFLLSASLIRLSHFLQLMNLHAAAAKSLQSYPTLFNPIEGRPPGSPVPGILQARTLEWVATSFSNAQKGKVKVKSLSRVQLLVTPWTEAYQVPPSMVFSRQKSTGVRCHCFLRMNLHRCIIII